MCCMIIVRYCLYENSVYVSYLFYENIYFMRMWIQVVHICYENAHPNVGAGFGPMCVFVTYHVHMSFICVFTFRVICCLHCFHIVPTLFSHNVHIMLGSPCAGIISTVCSTSRSQSLCICGFGNQGSRAHVFYFITIMGFCSMVLRSLA